MDGSVNIKLTEAQRGEINSAIGADVEELRFTTVTDVQVEAKGKLGESDLGVAIFHVKTPGRP